MSSFLIFSPTLAAGPICFITFPFPYSATPALCCCIKSPLEANPCSCWFAGGQTNTHIHRKQRDCFSLKVQHSPSTCSSTQEGTNKVPLFISGLKCCLPQGCLFKLLHWSEGEGRAEVECRVACFRMLAQVVRLLKYRERERVRGVQLYRHTALNTQSPKHPSLFFVFSLPFTVLLLAEKHLTTTRA